MQLAEQWEEQVIELLDVRVGQFKETINLTFVSESSAQVSAATPATRSIKSKLDSKNFTATAPIGNPSYYTIAQLQNIKDEKISGFLL